MSEVRGISHSLLYVLLALIVSFRRGQVESIN